MKALSKYFKKHKGKIIFYLFMYVVFYALTIYASLIVSEYLSSITENLVNESWRQLILLLSILVLAYAAHYILYMVGVMIEYRLMLDVKKDLKFQKLKGEHLLFGGRSKL